MRYVRASEEDEAKIRDFLAQFPPDYLLEAFPRYLTAKPGGLYMALDNDVLVAIAAIVMTRPHEAYLSGLRVLKEAASTGIHREFAGFQIEEARRAGARVVRAFVDETNTESLAALRDGLSFEQGTEWEVGLLNQIDPTGAELPLDAGPAWAVDQERLRAFWQEHRGALWTLNDPWVPVALTEEDLEHAVPTGGVAVVPQDTDEAIRGLALYQVKNRDTIDVRYLDGDEESRLDLLRFLRVEARAWGVTRLRYGMPRAVAEEVVRFFERTPESPWRGWILERSLTRAAVPSQ